MAAGTVIGIEQDVAYDKDLARTPAAYVSSKQLVANTHAEITIPAGAVFVWLEATLDTYFLMGATPVAAVPGNIDDGSACERINPSEGKPLLTKGNAKISVISAGTPIVTASFYKS